MATTFLFRSRAEEGAGNVREDQLHLLDTSGQHIGDFIRIALHVCLIIYKVRSFGPLERVFRNAP